MLNQHGHKTLHAAKRRAVNHHRAVFLVVLAYILQVKALWQVIVHLNSTQLPAAADGILHHEV